MLVVLISAGDENTWAYIPEVMTRTGRPSAPPWSLVCNGSKNLEICMLDAAGDRHLFLPFLRYLQSCNYLSSHLRSCLPATFLLHY